MDLPEGGKLKKLVVPPVSPLRPVGSGQQPDSSAALHEALAHGSTVISYPALHFNRILHDFDMTEEQKSCTSGFLGFPAHETSSSVADAVTMT